MPPFIPACRGTKVGVSAPMVTFHEPLTHLLAALARALDPAVAEDLLHPLGAHRLARACHARVDVSVKV